MRAAGSGRGLAPYLACATLALCAVSVRADSGWFESGDALLRADLTLLNDADVIRVPVNQWPIPRAAVRYALSTARDHFATNAAVAAALARVRARLPRESGVSFSGYASGGRAGLLRDFDTTAREDAEVGARAAYAGDRFSAALAVSGAASPEDGEKLRLDGSHATLQLGNWLVSANALDRFWGPSHESSLILSNNARPIPTLMVERAAALPFESRWLSWLGPWRFNFGVGQMENDRADIDSPLFMAWRVTIMPFNDIELGFSRTAQFCGEQLACDWDSFGNMLAGNDNVGIDATPENEPGNQMAGFDIRWSSPIGDWPYAIYSQMIGEDESSYLPVKYLNQFGIEAWKPFSDGAMLQVFAEYSATTCSATSGRGPYYDCAYNQGRFNAEGYRFHGRSIGHTADSDAQAYSLGAIYIDLSGDAWTATARTARLNFDGVDERNTVSAGPARYDALELGWRGQVLGDSVSLDLGVESLEPEGAQRDVEAFGFIRWQHEF